MGLGWHAKPTIPSDPHRRASLLLTYKPSLCYTDVGHIGLQELGDHHVDVLVLLLPPSTEETEVAPLLPTFVLGTLTCPFGSHHEVSGGVEKLDGCVPGQDKGRKEVEKRKLHNAPPVALPD